jgi:DNA-binding transcriptional ArsR family regulator
VDCPGSAVFQPGGSDVIFNPVVDDPPNTPDSPGMSDALDTVFAALADPTRRAILAMLLEDDMAVTDVAEPFAMSLAAISKHLGVLADAGLISRERRGRVIWCKLEPDAMRAASVWMQGFGQFEPLDLDAFERFLADELRDDQDQPMPETVTVGKARA